MSAAQAKNDRKEVMSAAQAKNDRKEVMSGPSEERPQGSDERTKKRKP